MHPLMNAITKLLQPVPLSDEMRAALDQLWIEPVTDTGLGAPLFAELHRGPRDLKVAMQAPQHPAPAAGSLSRIHANVPRP